MTLMVLEVFFYMDHVMIDDIIITILVVIGGIMQIKNF